MADSASVYISTYLREGTAVGIVSFSNSAYLHADMREITSSADRSVLVSALPRSAAGGTNIEVGLKECQRVKVQLIYYWQLLYAICFSEDCIILNLIQ